MRDLKQQTEAIVERLFEESDDSQGSLETDGISEDEAILEVARCLRKLGDEYNEMIQPHLKELKPQINQLVMDQGCETFTGMVTQLSHNPKLQTHLQQLGPEMNLLKIAVALGIQITKEVPDLLPKVKVAMADFINSRLLGWVQNSGGWENIKS
ncbi:apoptosis regulator BAX-like [Heptranchias perlo]|uniref:apoptosis regulator BAX-like n=1 Tax=Heptranchias perlo TaxID=212740 RepID=UPI003559DBB8